jgi:CheY-like chemotaxis protein
MAKARVLIVDDHDLDRKLSALDLEEAGFYVRQAGDVTEALELLKQHTSDIIVLDIRMPGTDGLTFLRGLKASPKLSKIPVVMLTSSDDVDDELAAMASGAVRYITKPAHREVLAETVKSVLEEARRPPS